jgi:hypothetical protein
VLSGSHDADAFDGRREPEAGLSKSGARRPIDLCLSRGTPVSDRMTQRLRRIAKDVDPMKAAHVDQGAIDPSTGR